MSAALEYTYRSRSGSLSRRAGEDAERASASLRRRTDRYTFRSLKKALGWFFETRERLQSPLSPRISAETADRVEGGEGSTIADAQANLSTIRQAMDRLLRERGPWVVELVELHHRDGMSIEKIADREKKSTNTISLHLGRGQTFLEGWLHGAAVLG